MAGIRMSDKTFDREVMKSEIPVLVDFYADWCSPCQLQSPILLELAEEYRGKVKVRKLNVDNNPKSASKYQVMSIPTLLLFKDGKMVKQMIGIQSKETLIKEINKVIK